MCGSGPSVKKHLPERKRDREREIPIQGTSTNELKINVINWLTALGGLKVIQSLAVTTLWNWGSQKEIFKNKTALKAFSELTKVRVEGRMLSRAFPGRHSVPTVTNAHFTRRPGCVYTAVTSITRPTRCQGPLLLPTAAVTEERCRFRKQSPVPKPCFPKSKPLD